MGLTDRAYTRRDDQRQPFSPPPERSGVSTLGMVLICFAILLPLYKIADWKLQQRATQHPGQPAADTAGSVERPAIKPAEPSTRSQLPQNADDTGAATHKVTKCVANGKTSYGDGPCTQGALASQVRIRSDHNLMAAVRPERVSTTPTEVRQRSAVAQSNPVVDAAAVKKA